MNEPRAPKFQWGQKVLTRIDLYNDGSYPERETDSLLVGQGNAGEVVQVGSHVESNTPVYLVEFAAGLVVGCLEDEIVAA
jgi:nitrogen fixation protein NifZ